jgi:hypothetical protein
MANPSIGTAKAFTFFRQFPHQVLILFNKPGIKQRQVFTLDFPQSHYAAFVLRYSGLTLSNLQ